MRIPALILCLLVPLFAGCGGGRPSYSQAQLNAIESREVDAGVEAAYSAASGALFDSGYTIRMSDRDAGLLTGTRTQKNTASQVGTAALVTVRNAVWVTLSLMSNSGSGYAERYPNMDSFLTVCLQVEPISDARSRVRVRTFINGEPKTDKDAIDGLWVLMQRQVMMKEPALATGAPTSPSATAAVVPTKPQGVATAPPTVNPPPPAPPPPAPPASSAPPTSPQSPSPLDITGKAPKPPPQ